MASPEYKAWKIYRSLDVEYVFVVFGGLVGYPSDDINKFLWMVGAPDPLFVLFGGQGGHCLCQ